MEILQETRFVKLLYVGLYSIEGRGLYGSFAICIFSLLSLHCFWKTLGLQLMRFLIILLRLILRRSWDLYYSLQTLAVFTWLILPCSFSSLSDPNQMNLGLADWDRGMEWNGRYFKFQEWVAPEGYINKYIYVYTNESEWIVFEASGDLKTLWWFRA